MSGDFLGVGWKHPLAFEGGRVARARHEESVQQAIWLILSTSRGERVMRPDFGCGIHDLVFAVNDAGTVGRVKSMVREALLRWEPRIERVEVDAAPDPTETNTLLIKIDYHVRSTDNRFNLVYPFYLEP